MITIQELLFNRGLDKSVKTKLVRHKDPMQDLYNLYRTDKPRFLKYQNEQSRGIFHRAEYVVSFIGEEGMQSRFIGVYKIIGIKKLHKGIFEYVMEEVKRFEDLRERVIVKWRNAISWHQWINNEMEVIQIHPGLHYKQFTDYSDFSLIYF